MLGEKDLLRGGDFLEALLSLGIARIDVRMMFQRKLSISLLDLVSGRAPLDTEHGIEIGLRRHLAVIESECMEKPVYQRSFRKC